MEPSKNDKLQRLLDYHLHLDNPDDRTETERTMAHDPEAQRLSKALQQQLKPLDRLAEQTAPAGLAEATLTYIAQHNQAQRLAQTSASIAHGRRSHAAASGTGRWIMSNLRDVIAVAACVGLLVMIGQPGIQSMRNVANQAACASQLRQVGTGLAGYAADNNGFMPYVHHKPGATWWNVGEQGSENTSNTRNVYLLVKNGYVPAGAFRCPGRQGKSRRLRVRIDPTVLETMQDFASRNDVDYSFRLMFSKPGLRLNSSPREVVMSDQNPLFADFDSSRHKEVDLVSNILLQQANSPNHRGAGQNLLCPDVSVRFVRKRYTDNSTKDDFFTIRSADRYRGNEVPTDDDIFIGP